jgi:uncharacterized membrane protein
MRIEFDIDELVLVGFDPRDRHRLADAIERAIETRATSEALLPLARGSDDVEAVHAPDVAPVRGASAAALADGVGASVVAGIAAQGGARAG